jgi:nitrite reductase/ring-hydroxylating ferredoxin subunit
MTPRFSLAQILNGKLLVWRTPPERHRRLERCRATILDSIATLISPHAAKAVAKDGLEMIHRHVSALDLRLLTDVLSDEFRPEAESFARFFVQHTDADPRPIFLAPQAWVRFMAPESMSRQHATDVGRYYGHLVAHDPHRDSWFSQALNVVNLWMAVGHVAEDNGLLLYPGQYGKRVDTVRGRLVTSHPLEKPLRCALDPGDVLIFHGEHLHSSALNLTAKTRVVLSFRFTVGRPRFSHDGERYRYRRLMFGPRRRPPARGLVIETLAALPSPADGHPTPVSIHQCAVPTSKGLLYVSSRCPHRGADLSACGYIDRRTNSLLCAWHGVTFSLETGASRGAPIRSLEISTAPKGVKPTIGPSD